jgi:polyisoprenoid-binding protein YceI
VQASGKTRSTARLLSAIIALSGIGGVCELSSGQVFATETGHVEFTSSVPLHTFTGQSDRLVGVISLADSTVDFYVDLETLDTGNGKRDKDMRQTLETERFPFAEFFGKLVSPFDPAGEGSQSVRARGEFKVHGVARTVEIEGTLEADGGALHLTAAWELQLTDYDIVPPSLLVIKVDEVQRIRLAATLFKE